MTSVVSLRDGAFRSHYAAKKLHLGNMPDLSGSAEHLIGLGLSGPDLDRALRERVARKVSINCFHEQLPEFDNRIQPSATETDAKVASCIRRAPAASTLPMPPSGAWDGVVMSGEQPAGCPFGSIVLA